MKKLWSVLVLTLAANFLFAVAGVAWLWTSGRLDREKVAALREVLQPPGPTTAPVAVVDAAPATRPADAVGRMEAALAAAAGRGEWAEGGAAGELDARRAAVASAAAALDRRRRELDDLQRLLASSRTNLERDRAALAAEKKSFEADRAAAALAADAGFQATLKLYESMQAKQAKAIFLAMSDDVVVRYLSAMETRTQTKILREFKSPDETLRVKKLLELMRQDKAQPPVPLAGSAALAE